MIPIRAELLVLWAGAAAPAGAHADPGTAVIGLRASAAPGSEGPSFSIMIFCLADTRARARRFLVYFSRRRGQCAIACIIIGTHHHHLKNYMHSGSLGGLGIAGSVDRATTAAQGRGQI